MIKPAVPTRTKVKFSGVSGAVVASGIKDDAAMAEMTNELLARCAACAESDACVCVHTCRGCLLPLLLSLGQPGLAPMSAVTHLRRSPHRRMRQRRRSAAAASSSRSLWRLSRGPRRRQRPPQARAGVRRGPRRRRQADSWRA